MSGEIKGALTAPPQIHIHDGDLLLPRRSIG